MIGGSQQQQQQQQRDTMGGQALAAFMGMLLTDSATRMEDIVIIPDNCRVLATSCCCGTVEEEDDCCPVGLCRWDNPGGGGGGGGGCHNNKKNVTPPIRPPPRRRLSLQDLHPLEEDDVYEEETESETPCSTTLPMIEGANNNKNNSISSSCRFDLFLNSSSNHSSTSINSSDAPPRTPLRKASLTDQNQVDLQLLDLGASCSSLLGDSSSRLMGGSNSTFDTVMDSFSELMMEDNINNNNPHESVLPNCPWPPIMRVPKTA